MAKVLITVKTSPTPSTKYGDTVCVAGVRLDGSKPEWVRLYPVPFRWLVKDQQFRKYEIVDVDIKPASKDDRPESHNPNLESLKRETAVNGWANRYKLLKDLPVDTMCGLIEGIRNNIKGQSLGWIKARDIDIRIFPHPGWTDEELEKMINHMQLERDALIPIGNMPPLLQAPRFKVQYSFTCEQDGCRGHNSQILDWELTAFQRNSSKLSDEQLRENIKKRFLDGMHGENKESWLFVGNIAKAHLRHNFSILGVFYPSKKDIKQYLPDQNRLFDELL